METDRMDNQATGRPPWFLLGDMLLERFSASWWVVALRGLAAIIFGIVALIWPDITLGALILIYGAYAMADGVVSIYAAIRSGADGQAWGALLLRGVLGIGAGLVALLWPGLSALALMFVIGFTAIATGAFEITAAFRLRKEIAGEWALGLAGLLSIGFGLVMVIFPGAGAVSLVWLIGTYALFLGVALVVLAFRLRGLRDGLSRP